MDAQFIEKLDRRRFKNLLWQTIGFGLFIPGVVLDNQTFDPRAIRIAFTIFVGISAVVFVVGTLLVSHSERQIRRNPELGKILNNELVVLYNYKSLKWAFSASLAAVIILLYLSTFRLATLTVPMSCLIILYITVLSQKISRLVYLRK